MIIKKILNYIVIFILLLFTKYCYSFERKYLYEIVKETLVLYENNNENSEKLEKNFNLVEEIIKYQLNIGYEHADLDLYLFLKGIIKDDIYSLQSLLVNIENQNLSLDIADLINPSIAKKMSFALKENRISNKTKIKIKSNRNIKSCYFYLNGKKLKNINNLFSPSGIPVYFAMYCEKLFEIQRVMPESAQSTYNLYFNNLKIKNNVPNTIPNPYPSNYQKNLDIKTEENIVINENNSAEINFMSGYLFNYNKKISNNFTFNSQVIINKYLLMLGYSTLQMSSKKITTLFKNNLFEYSILKPHNLFKFGLGIQEKILNNNIIQLHADLVLISSFLFDTDFNYQRTLYGIQSSLKISYQFTRHWNIGLNTSFGYNISTYGGFFLEPSFCLNYLFY